MKGLLDQSHHPSCDLSVCLEERGFSMSWVCHQNIWDEHLNQLFLCCNVCIKSHRFYDYLVPRCRCVFSSSLVSPWHNSACDGLTREKQQLYSWDPLWSHGESGLKVTVALSFSWRLKGFAGSYVIQLMNWLRAAVLNRLWVICITLWGEAAAALQIKLRANLAKEAPRFKYTLSPNKIGHAVFSSNLMLWNK